MFKLDKNKKYFTISLYAAAILAITILAVLIGLNFSTIRTLFKRFSVVTSPILIGLLISYFCNPIVRLYEGNVLKFKTDRPFYSKLKRILAILLAYISVLAIIALMLFLTLPKILENYEALIKQLSDFVVKIVGKLDEFLKSFNVEDIDKTIYEAANKLIDNIGARIADWSARALVTLAKVLIGCILSFYILLNKEDISVRTKKYCAAIMPKKLFALLYSVLKEADNAFGRYFIGSIFDSILIGIMTFIVCWLLKIPYYSVVSVIVCITNVIPYFGPFLGAIPSFIIIFIFSPIKAVWFAVVILVLQQIDGNIIAPRVLGNAVGLSSLWVITAVTIMGGLFGLVGMIIGIPLFSIIYTFVRDFVNYRLKKRNMPTSLSAYENVFSFTESNPAAPTEARNEKEETDK